MSVDPFDLDTQPSSVSVPPSGVYLHDVADLHPWDRNPRAIDDPDLARLKRMLTHDPAMLWVRPLIARPDGTVIMGNQRLRAARELGWLRIPTTTVILTDERAREWALRDNNPSGRWVDVDLATLLAEMQGAGQDLDLAGFGEDELGRLLGDLERQGEPLRPDPPSLSERFVVPPFSVLDQRQGYWQERRRRWLSLGIKSELGRDAPIGGAPLPLDRAKGDTYLGLNTSETPIGGLVDPTLKGETMGDQILGGRKAEGSRGMPTGVLMPSVSGRDPSFYEQKRTVEATLGRTITTDEFIRTYYVPQEGVGGLTTTGTSVFDPVLCEIAYRWFSPPGARVLDPFAGGSVRGVARRPVRHQRRVVRSRPDAPILGVRVGADPTPVLDRYAPDWRQWVELVETGVPFEEKVPGDLDGIVLDGTYEAKCLPYLRPGDLLWIVGGPQAPTPNLPEWRVGDLRAVDQDLETGSFDLVFTCPPYYDLERYSDDPDDLSTMTTAGFEAAYEEILHDAVSLLAADSFVVIVVSDVRDKQGIYRPLADTTTRIMEQAGLGLYNRAVLVNTIGSLAVRVGRQFSVGRKLGRTHQDVLVYVKGDPRRAAERCGQVDVTLEEVLDAETGEPVDDDHATDPAGS